jgi:hypothetical protein
VIHAQDQAAGCLSHRRCSDDPSSNEKVYRFAMLAFKRANAADVPKLPRAADFGSAAYITHSSLNWT